MIFDYQKWRARIDSHLFEILRGSALAVIAKILSAAGVFLLNILIARKLGAEESGYFFLSLSIITILSAILRQGFDNALIRFIAGFNVQNDNVSVSKVYYALIIRVLPMSLLAVCILYPLSKQICTLIFDKPLLSSSFQIMVIAAIPFTFSMLHGFCFQAVKRVVMSIFSISAALPIIMIPLLLLINPDSSLEVSSIYLFSVALVCVISISMWNNGRLPKVSKIDSNLLSELNQALTPLALVTIMNMVILWSAPIMLGIWGSSADVAIFTAANRTATLTSFVLMAVNTIAAPKFAEAFRLNDANTIKNSALGAGRLMTFLAIPILIFMLASAEPLMRLFGPEFEQGSNILRILAVGQFVSVISGSVGMLLQMTGRERILRNNVFYVSVFVIVCGPIAISIWGAVGAALVVAIAVASQNLLCVYQVNKELGFNTLKVW